jgi:hypothetical protein
MRQLSGKVALVAVLVVGAGVLSPATAGPGEDPRTVRVRAECTPQGTIVLRHTTTGDTTDIGIRGSGLGEGRWRGEHELAIGVDDTYDTQLDLDADHGDLRGGIDIDDSGTAGVLRLAHGEHRECFASFDESPARIIMGSGTDSIAVWHRDPRRYVTRGQIDCRPGSQWAVEVGVGFDDGGFGAGARPFTCNRLGFLRFHWESRIRPPEGTPTELTYVGRNLDTGNVRRLSYHASSPATRPAVD